MLPFHPTNTQLLTFGPPSHGAVLRHMLLPPGAALIPFASVASFVDMSASPQS